MAAQIFPYGTALTVVWHLSKPDGTDFDITGYTYRVYYRTGNKETEANGSHVTASGNTISIVIPATEPSAPGEYALRLVLYQNNRLFCTLNYNAAFVLSRRLAQDLAVETQQEEVQVVHLYTVAEFYLFTPIIPTVGSDGYWYVNGTKVTDGQGEFVPSSHTMEYDAQTNYIIIDRGRVDSQGRSIAQTITSLADALSTAAQDHETAQEDHSTAAGDHQTAEADHSTATWDHQAIVDMIDLYEPITINGDVTNAPDEEDITSDENDLLKFKDRGVIYGMGYCILRRNKTFAEQVTETDTIYEIRYDFDLNGGSASIPAGCTLFFNGGSLSNGSVVGNGTKVVAANYEIFKHGIVKYRGYLLNGDYGVSVNTGTSIILSGTWNNSSVGSAWTGLPFFDGNTTASAELALKNYVLLHGGDVVFHKKGDYYFYNGTSKIDLRFRSCDFSGSSLSIIDYANVHDSTIAIPSGATGYTVNSVETLKRVGDLIWMGGSHNSLRNLTISDRAIARGEKVLELGTVHCVRINSDSHDIILEDVVFTDVLDCAVPIAETSYDITFERNTFEKIGEHGIYSHAYHGFLRFRDCKFIDCSLSPEVSQLRSGRSACIRNRIENITTGDLVVECDNCYFYCTPSSYGGEGQSVGCITMMDTPYRSYFRNCTWEGKINGCSAYVSEMLLSAYGDLPEYVFENCLAPCGIYQSQNVNNIRIRYRSCTNVRYALWYAVEITDCECVLSYISLPQNFNTTLFPNELDRHLVVSNSRFVAAGDGNNANKITSNSRSIDFNNCTFEGRTSDSHTGLIELVLGDRTVSFTGCVFDAKSQRLLIITADSGTTQKIYLYSCKFKSAYSSYFMVPAGTFFEVIGCSIDSSSSSTTLSSTSDLPRQAAGNFDKNSWFICKKNVASAKDGSVITLSGSKNMRFSTSFDITPYITVQPLSHFEDYTFTVTNNGTTSDSTITLAGPQTNGAYLVTLDLSNIGA